MIDWAREKCFWRLHSLSIIFKLFKKIYCHQDNIVNNTFTLKILMWFIFYFHPTYGLVCFWSEWYFLWMSREREERHWFSSWQTSTQTHQESRKKGVTSAHSDSLLTQRCWMHGTHWNHSWCAFITQTTALKGEGCLWSRWLSWACVLYI